MSVHFPNLFVIGAMKAGTSSLHEYLHQHPQIFMSRFKEPQYFHPHKTIHGWWGEGNRLPGHGIEWYLRLFAEAGDVKYAGESSTSYAKLPVVTGCAERIKRFNAEARIIYLLRDPVERALSHYWYYVNNGAESRDLMTALTEDVQYTAYSDYALQLKPYLEAFGPEDVYLLTVEELNADPRRTFERLFKWLGVDSSFIPSISVRQNVTPSHVRRLRPFLSWLSSIRGHWRWQQIEALTPQWLKALARRVSYENVDRHAMDLRQALTLLRDVQRSQTIELERLAGRRFREWKMLNAA